LGTFGYNAQEKRAAAIGPIQVKRGNIRQPEANARCSHPPIADSVQPAPLFAGRLPGAFFAAADLPPLPPLRSALIHPQPLKHTHTTSRPFPSPFTSQHHPTSSHLTFSLLFLVCSTEQTTNTLRTCPQIERKQPKRLQRLHRQHVAQTGRHIPLYSHSRSPRTDRHGNRK